jgi:hypothetical protein
MTSHESACMVNVNDAVANVEMTVYFADREPAAPTRCRYRLDGSSTYGSTT